MKLDKYDRDFLHRHIMTEYMAVKLEPDRYKELVAHLDDNEYLKKRLEKSKFAHKYYFNQHLCDVKAYFLSYAAGCFVFAIGRDIIISPIISGLYFAAFCRLVFDKDICEYVCNNINEMNQKRLENKYTRQLIRENNKLQK